MPKPYFKLVLAAVPCYSRNMNKKRAIVASFAAALIFLFAACSNPGDGSTLQTLVFEGQLRSLPNVESVQAMNIKSDFKGTLYKVYFESPLDPTDISKGTFRQKAFVGFAGYERPNCLMTTGYMLSDAAALKRIAENEAAYILEGNLIAVEHRYFGDSVRTDKTREYGNYDGSYWEYLTTKNAAEDLHAIVSQLKVFLKGKWVAQGASKGGLTANLFCYYHPEDVDVTMPYVAPLCNSKADPRMFEFIYTKAGDNDIRYNRSGSAASYRELLTNIQLWYLEKRDEKYRDGLTYKEIVNNLKSPGEGDQNIIYDMIYEMYVGNFPVGIWQYRDDKYFAELKKFYELPTDDDTAVDSSGKSQAKKDYIFAQLTALSSDTPAGATLPYSFQSYFELGNYGLDYSYLRMAVAQAQARGSKAKIVTTPGEEAYLPQLSFSDAEISLFDNYTTAVHDNLINWIKTTDEQVIMIYGNSDPWYAVRIPDVYRDNVHIFVHPANNHYSMIENFPEAQKNELEMLLRIYLY